MVIIPADVDLISFDVWGTLVKPNKGYSATRARVVAEVIGWTGDAETAATALRAACDELDAEMDRTGTCLNFAPRIDLTCAKLSLPTISTGEMAKLEHQVMESHRKFPPHLTEDSLLYTLAALRSWGYRLAVISNTGITSGETLRALLADVGILHYINYELYSDEVGYSKPSSEIFAALARMSGVAPEHTLHIGDNRVADYQGATDSGLHGLWYTTKEEGDHVIQELRQLV